MSDNVFTLDALREDTRRKFAPVQIGLKDKSKVELRSILRLGKDDRKQVVDALGAINDLDIESDNEEDLELVVEQISKVLNVVCDKPAKLLKELDDPEILIKVDLMTSVLNRWAKETQLGEA
jgi:hypothetical protein